MPGRSQKGRKGLSEYQRRASQLQTGPSPAGGREAGRQQPEPEGKEQSGPRDSILYETASSLPVANQVFLESWTFDIHQEGRSQRSTLQRRHRAQLRQHSGCAPRKPSGWDRGDDGTYHTTGESALTKHLVT